MTTGGRQRFIAIVFLATASAAHGQAVTVVTESFPPYNYTDEASGARMGLGTEMVQALLAEVGLDAEIQEFPWARAYAMAQDQPGVLIYSMKRNADRETKFKWVGQIVISEAYLVALKGTTIAPSARLDDFKRYRVGAVQAGANARQLAADGFPNVVLFGERETCWLRLRTGHIDLWCTDILSARFYARKAGDDPSLAVSLIRYEALSREGLWVAFSPGTDDVLVERFRQAWKRLEERGVLAAILARYAGR